MADALQHVIPVGASFSSDDASVGRTMAQFFEATSDAIFFLDRNWVITFLNAKAKATLAPSGDVIGTVIWDSFPEAAAPGSEFWSNYHRTMNEGVATHFDAFYPAPLDHWFDVHALPCDDGIILRMPA